MTDHSLTAADRAAIAVVLHRYARGVDRMDWAMVRSAYHPDAVDTHGSYSGGIDGFIDYLVARHATIEQSLHLVTNILVEPFGPDHALVESYYLCFQRLRSAGALERAIGGAAVGEGETLQITAAGRYIDRFERRAEAWRIARRTVTFDVLGTQATPLGGGLEPTLIASRRDDADALHTERAAMMRDIGTG